LSVQGTRNGYSAIFSPVGATAETTLGAIYRKFLRQVAAKEQAEEEELRATERFGLFLAPGLLLVLVAAFLSRGRFAGTVKRLKS